MYFRVGIISVCIYLLQQNAAAQELYVFSDPASVLPARSLSLKWKNHFVTRDNIYGRFSARLMPQLMAGISRKLMLRAGMSVANMHTPGTRFESADIYLRYRFLSEDAVHKHFRMAAYLWASHSRIPFHYDEISLMGDKSGIEAGLVATQLWHRLALSVTAGHTQVLHRSKNDGVLYIPERGYQSFNYSMSGGLLVLPISYRDYRQTNVNVYLELLGQQLTDKKAGFLDMAPALQFIFNSNSKLNAGYRFQLTGSMQRMARKSWLISFEKSFFNAWKKRSRHS